MSTPSTPRRRVQRYGIAGIGSAVLFVGIASPAAAATDVVIPLAPTEIGLFNHSTENVGAAPVNPVTDWDVEPSGSVLVQFGDTLVVDLADGVDPSNAEVEIVFTQDADSDGEPDRVTSTGSVADPLAVSMVNGNDLEIVLPADMANGASAELFIDALEVDNSVLGPEFLFVDPTVYYDLSFVTAPPSVPVLKPELVALAQVPCDLSAGSTCAIAVTAGDTLVLDLTADSALRDLGLTDLTGIEIALQDVNDPDPHFVPLSATVDGSRALAVIPDHLAAGTYALVLGQPTLTGVSIVFGELDVDALPAVAPAAAPTTAAPTVQAVAGNVGLRSNTGVTAPAEESSAGVLAGGLGLLALAGAGGVAVARTRRPAATGAGEV